MPLHMPIPVLFLGEVLVGSSCWWMRFILPFPYPAAAALAFIWRPSNAPAQSSTVSQAHNTCPHQSMFLLVVGQHRCQQPAGTSNRSWWKPVVLLWETVLRCIICCMRKNTSPWRNFLQGHAALFFFSLPLPSFLPNFFSVIFFLCKCNLSFFFFFSL